MEDCKSLYDGSNPSLSSMKNEVKNFISLLSRMGDRNMFRIVWFIIIGWTIVFWLGIFKLVGLI